MLPTIATLICTIGILGLFWLVRGDKSRTSGALWIPAAWLFLASSRPVSVWLGIAPPSADLGEVYVEGSPADRAVYMLLVVVALAVLVARRHRIWPVLRRNAPILLFFFFCGLSVMWSDFPFVALKRYVKALGDLEMVLIILTELDPMAAITETFTRLGFILFPLSVLFIKYYPDLGRVITQSWTSEAIGVAQQKNSLGGICFVYGLVFVWCFRRTYRDRGSPTRKRRLFAYGTILAVIVWLLRECNSMTSIVVLTLAGGVMLLVDRRSVARKRTLVHSLVVGIVGTCVFSLFIVPATGLLQTLGRNPTLTGRTEIWSLLLGVHTNPLIGTGFESFWLGPRLETIWAATPNFPVNEAHNGYIEVYLNLGWAGLSILSVLIASGYSRATATLRKDSERGSLFLAFFLATILQSFTEAAFRMMGLTWLILLLVTAADPAMCSPLGRTLSLGRKAMPEIEEAVTSAVTTHRNAVSERAVGRSR